MALGAEGPRETCTKWNPSQPITDRGDWRVYEEIPALEEDFNELYTSERRLKNRVYWDEGLRSYRIPSRDGSDTLNVPIEFIENLRLHLKTSLQRGYAEFLLYPDLGHFHLLIPDSSRVLPHFSPGWEEALSNSNALMLFHTGEMIRFKKGSSGTGELVEDPWLQWRYYTRNFWGRNNGSPELPVVFARDQSYNTVRRLEGYREAGVFLVSGNQSGCFAVELGTRSIFFDLAY